jgi:hypothetical protein
MIRVTKASAEASGSHGLSKKRGVLGSTSVVTGMSSMPDPDHAFAKVFSARGM